MRYGVTPAVFAQDLEIWIKHVAFVFANRNLTHFEKLEKKIGGPEVVDRWIIPADKIPDDDHIKRLEFAQLFRDASEEVFRNGLASRGLRPSLYMGTTCQDARCQVSSVHRLSPSEATITVAAGNIIPEYSPLYRARSRYMLLAPHPFWMATRLYCGWQETPHATEHVSGIYGRPTFIVSNHSDCAATKLMAASKRTWNRDDDIYDLMRSHDALFVRFRRDTERSYGQAVERDITVLDRMPIHDYFSRQLERDVAYKIMAGVPQMLKGKDMLTHNPHHPVVIIVHDNMDGTFDVLDPRFDPLDERSVVYTFGEKRESVQHPVQPSAAKLDVVAAGMKL